MEIRAADHRRPTCRVEGVSGIIGFELPITARGDPGPIVACNAKRLRSMTARTIGNAAARIDRMGELIVAGMKRIRLGDADVAIGAKLLRVTRLARRATLACSNRMST